MKRVEKIGRATLYLGRCEDVLPTLQAAVYGEMQNDYRYDSTERYPRSVIKFAQDTQSSSEHDTQKPVELMLGLRSIVLNAERQP